MRRALRLARRGAGQVAPNPLVGAVVVRDGRVVGEGWHARFGEAHAEVRALAQAGAAARGATLYVTLEPCRHHGKTPPCTEAILRSGVARVVYATPDPHVAAAGGGAQLSASGVSVTAGVFAREAEELNAPFLFAARGATRPWVTAKLALSLDGALVDASRGRAWLTGPRARRAVHRLRAEADAVAVGIGTVLADDPRLTVRGVARPRVAPLRVVFDRGARLPLDSALVRSVREAPLVVVTDGRHAGAEAALQARGAEVIVAPELGAALGTLRARGVRHLLVEGGAGIASALLEAGLIDRLIIFRAPVILGAGALPAFSALPPQPAAAAPRWRVVAHRWLGDDGMTTYARSGE